MLLEHINFLKGRAYLGLCIGKPRQEEGAAPNSASTLQRMHRVNDRGASPKAAAPFLGAATSPSSSK
jgi:hypothetical protein